MNSRILTAFLFLTLLTIGCSKHTVKHKLQDSNTFIITEFATDETYGYTEENPVKVGGVNDSEGPLNERRFLNALAGPSGEKISYERKGNCCMFETPNGFLGGGLLDIYEVTWSGQKEPVQIYINMYDSDLLKVPVGMPLKNPIN